MRDYIPEILSIEPHTLVYCDARRCLSPGGASISRTDQPSWKLAFTGLVSLSIGKIWDVKT